MKLYALEVGAGITAKCERCGHYTGLGHLSKPEAERELGRFAVIHGRCGERPLVLVPIRAHLRRVIGRPMTLVRKRG